MLTPEGIEAERVEFEAWAKPAGFRLKRSGEVYLVFNTFSAWSAWLARAEQAKLDNEAREVGA